MTYDSIYPEFFKTGIGKLQKQDALNGQFLGLFFALEHFRRDITDRHDAASILQVTERYLFGLGLFSSLGFFLVNPGDMDFKLAHCAPTEGASDIERLVRAQIAAGRFAWALRQNSAVSFSVESEPGGAVESGVLHTLGVATHRVGMFCGLLKRQRVPTQEVTFSLLTILLGAASDALAAVRTAEELQRKVLAANDSLQRALRENEVLARIPAESPDPILRLNRNGRILYANDAGARVLSALGCQEGDMISGQWLERLDASFQNGSRDQFEATFDGRVYSFLIVPLTEAGYANFYGTDTTARKAARPNANA